MRTIMVVALALASLSAWAPARAPQEKPQDAATPAAQFEAIKAEFTKAQEEFYALYRQAKTDQEREKLYDEKYPKAEVYAARARAVAAKWPKDPVAADCLVWVLSNSRGEPGETDAILDALVKDHLESKALVDACRSGGFGPKFESFLRAVMEKSPHKDVRGQACYSLAMSLQHRADLAARVKEGTDAEMLGRLEKYYGRETLDALRKGDPAAWTAEAEKRLEEVVAKYGDVESYAGTLADQAKGDLFEMRNLAVGKAAPEIEGEDIDGKPFKLSDYRGKVVFLDFWGYW